MFVPETNISREAGRGSVAVKRWVTRNGGPRLAAARFRWGGSVKDQRTGYYVAGRDWPAISSNIPLADIYRALDGIDDDDVRAAMNTLQTVQVPSEGVRQDQPPPSTSAEDR